MRMTRSTFRVDSDTGGCPNFPTAIVDTFLFCPGPDRRLENLTISNPPFFFSPFEYFGVLGRRTCGALGLALPLMR